MSDKPDVKPSAAPESHHPQSLQDIVKATYSKASDWVSAAASTVKNDVQHMIAPDGSINFNADSPKTPAQPGGQPGDSGNGPGKDYSNQAAEHPPITKDQPSESNGHPDNNPNHTKDVNPAQPTSAPQDKPIDMTPPQSGSPKPGAGRDVAPPAASEKSPAGSSI